MQAGKPFLGICLGMQLLFEGSEENGGVEGLGVIPGRVTKFDTSLGLPVPHIGWNTLEQRYTYLRLCLPVQASLSDMITAHLSFACSWKHAKQSFDTLTWPVECWREEGKAMHCCTACMLNVLESCPSVITRASREAQEVCSLQGRVNVTPCRRESKLLAKVGDRRVYFVHSYRATPLPENDDWVLATTEYGGSFISAVQKGEINATQFHPEKSGTAGLDIIESFLEVPEEARPAYTNGELLEGCIHVFSWE